MTIDNNDNNSTGNNGNRGRFSDRLKKMRRDRLKRRKGIIVGDEENPVKTTSRNILKVVLAMPSVVYTSIVSNKKDNSKNKCNSKNKENHEIIDDILCVNDIVRDKTSERRIKVSKIRDIDVSLLRKKKELYLKDLEKSGIFVGEEVKNIVDEQIKIANLQKEILSLIKKKLIKNVNELEVLQSELYILKELDGNSVYFDECKENIKEIKKLLSKIKALKEKYDYLKDNVDFEYMLEYGDDLLIDKILELKEICSRDDIKYVVDNYKILDEYKYMYLKIDKLYDDTIRLEDYRDKKVEELKQRDIDFEKLKKDVYDVDKEKERFDRFVSEQDSFLQELEKNISRINSYEQVKYRLRGFNRLVGSSFKYLGLLLANPLKGLIPGIAVQTVIARNMVRNIRKNLVWEESRRMVYEAVDYSNAISSAISSLDNTSILINSTLEDIVTLKNEYKTKFSGYENEIPGYRDTIRKINKIQNAILGSKVKIDLMKTRMLEKERQNSIKLKRVKKLNNPSNS